MSIGHNDRIECQCVEAIAWQIFDNQFPAIILDRLTSNDQMIEFDVISQSEFGHKRLIVVQNHFWRWIRINSTRIRMVGILHNLIRYICSALKWKFVYVRSKIDGVGQWYSGIRTLVPHTWPNESEHHIDLSRFVLCNTMCRQSLQFARISLLWNPDAMRVWLQSIHNGPHQSLLYSKLTTFLSRFDQQQIGGTLLSIDFKCYKRI